MAFLVALQDDRAPAVVGKKASRNRMLDTSRKAQKTKSFNRSSFQQWVNCVVSFFPFKKHEVSQQYDINI